MKTFSRILNAFLILGSIWTVLFWMPYGFAYYDWPRQDWGWRVIPYLIQVVFLIGSIAGCFSAFRNGFSIRRFVLPAVALLVAIFGVLAMYDTQSRYVFKAMLHGANTH